MFVNYHSSLISCNEVTTRFFTVTQILNETRPSTQCLCTVEPLYSGHLFQEPMVPDIERFHCIAFEVQLIKVWASMKRRKKYISQNAAKLPTDEIQ